MFLLARCEKFVTSHVTSTAGLRAGNNFLPCVKAEVNFNILICIKFNPGITLGKKRFTSQNAVRNGECTYRRNQN